MSEETKQTARDLGLDNNRFALLNAADEPTPEALVAALRRIAEGAGATHEIAAVDQSASRSAL